MAESSQRTTSATSNGNRQARSQQQPPTAETTARRGSQQRNVFLDDIQKEMDLQRLTLKDEVDKLLATTGSSDHSSNRHSLNGSNGYRHTSPSRRSTSGQGHRQQSQEQGGENGQDSASTTVLYTEPSTFVHRPNGDNGPAVFCALVDVSEYPDSDVSVTYDDAADQIVVYAQRLDGADGRMITTFTQRVKMPRFADHSRMRCRKRKDNLLAIEVPLLFYFPEDFAPEKRKAKSFLNGVRTHRDGSQSLEILVNPGADFTPDDLKVKVDREANKLVVFASRSNSKPGASPQSTVIKQYALSEQADIERISKRHCKDGRLSIIVPLRARTGSSSSAPKTPTSAEVAENKEEDD